MDDYMREMLDLKTLVTKTLEKRGVLARIRAELRANVFQAMEEQDHEAESNGSTTFSLLGTCKERAKELHSSTSGKLLTALVCEYLEWCGLDHTLKVYMPELNQPRDYDRAELVDILGLVAEPKGESADSRPLLLSIVESFLSKNKEASAQAKEFGQGAAGGQRQSSGNPSSDVDPSAEAPEARVTTSSKKLSEKPMGGSHDDLFQSRSETEPVGSANGGTVSSRVSDDSQKLHEKSSNRAQALLSDLPRHRRSSGATAFSGVSRAGVVTRGSNNGSANDQQTVVGGVDSGGSHPRGSRDRENDGMGREYSWTEEDEGHGGSSGNKKNEGGNWRDEDYDNPQTIPATRSEKGDGKGEGGEDSLSEGGRSSSMENPSKAMENLHLDDDSASEVGGRQSSRSSGTGTSQQWQGAPRENGLPGTSAGSKKQASAYFYSDSEEENAPE